MTIATHAQTLRIDGVSKTVVAEIATDPETGQALRYYRFFTDDQSEPVLTLYVGGATSGDIEVTIPEHAF